MNAVNANQARRYALPKAAFYGLALGLAAALAGCQSAPSVPVTSDIFAQTSAPRLQIGDTYTYRLADGYGNLEAGQVTYRVGGVATDHVMMSVEPTVPRGGSPRTEIYTPEGNWLRRALSSHNELLNYQFTPAIAAYALPLNPGKAWSVRVAATHEASGTRRSIRVDSKVVGTERIRVPAGEFDTIKIRRYIYTGDMTSLVGFANGSTKITETDWYSPALGRSVRIDSMATWTERFQFDGFRYGDWNVYELVSVPRSVQGRL